MIWIIRLDNGYLRSFHGTREEAEAVAEELKLKTGCNYIII